MKKFISTFLLPIFSSILIAPMIVTHAATTTGNVTQFEITAPATANANEAIDITVRAVDSNNQTVTSYRGSIIFIAGGYGDTVPMQGRSISFTAEDNGEKKFSKGVIFKNPGKQKIFITDISDDNLTGETTVTVAASGGTSTGTTGETVTIISPENNTKITSDTVAVSGNTRRNSKVNLKLNNVVVGSTISDSDGIFTKTLSGISQQNNILSVEVLDANNSVIGTSANINIEKVEETAGIFNVTVAPSTTVEVSSPITISIDADPGMTTMNIELDSATLTAKEGAPGKYTLMTVAPAKPGTYPINITAVNAVGNSTSKPAATQLNVTNPVSPIVISTGTADSGVTSSGVTSAPTPAFKNVLARTEVGGRITFTFGVENAPSDLNKFKIVYGDSPDGFSSETITYTADKIRGNDGLFHWYVDKLTPKTYYFKIFGMRADGTLMDALSSDSLSATIGKDGCVIGNVGAVTVETRSDKSILSWDPVPGAVSYNLYKVSAAGDSMLFQNVKDTQYTIFLSKGNIVYEDFAIKALCDDSTESTTPTMVSKVQTGPAYLVILVILSGIFGAVLLRRKAG